MRIVFYFMHNPWPPRSGAHQRCLQILRELRAAGHEVIFSSSILHTEQIWNQESKEAIGEITGQTVHVYENPGRITWRINMLEKRFRLRVLGKNGFRELLFCPYSLIRWFRKLVNEQNPEAVFINYAWFDQLIDHQRWATKLKIIEIHDLVSINVQMRNFVERQMARTAKHSDSTDFREEFAAARHAFQVNPQEVEIYQRYNSVVSISKTEQTLLQSRLRDAKVIHAPFTFEPISITNTYAGPALLSLGPNPFNLQGFLYFQKSILPQILAQAPGFRLTVTGSLNPDMCRHPAIEWKGFVENRDALFQMAGFAVCPVFAGTGQQIKIEEALANGLAVVAFKEAAENSSLKHGENALVANSSGEFAKHVARLQNDLELRASLGQNAKRRAIEQWQNGGGLRAFARNLGKPASHDIEK